MKTLGNRLWELKTVGPFQTPSRRFCTSRGSKRVDSKQLSRVRQGSRPRVRRGSLSTTHEGSTNGSFRVLLPAIYKHCRQRHFGVCFLLCRVCNRCRAPNNIVQDCLILYNARQFSLRS
ncbi:hypothetical protein V6N11_057816 [Hibiscus sabdariffa]|uniref:Uncharacterized protein n=2 Tax=Hibiscus sabdariffa TaxID=183260 RepID=A0ABR2CB52_9ROSI